MTMKLLTKKAKISHLLESSTEVEAEPITATAKRKKRNPEWKRAHFLSLEHHEKSLNKA
jgi:hypothetical protein